MPTKLDESMALMAFAVGKMWQSNEKIPQSLHTQMAGPTTRYFLVGGVLTIIEIIFKVILE